MRNLYFLILGLAMMSYSCQNANKKNDSETTISSADTILYPGEKHFKSLRQLTFGGDNA
jgi:hypothetical protein